MVMCAKFMVWEVPEGWWAKSGELVSLDMLRGAHAQCAAANFSAKMRNRIDFSAMKCGFGWWRIYDWCSQVWYRGFGGGERAEHMWEGSERGPLIFGSRLCILECICLDSSNPFDFHTHTSLCNLRPSPLAPSLYFRCRVITGQRVFGGEFFVHDLVVVRVH